MPQYTGCCKYAVLNGYHQKYSDDVEEYVDEYGCPFGEILCAETFVEECAYAEEYAEEECVSHHRGEHFNVEHLDCKSPDSEVHGPDLPVDISDDVYACNRDYAEQQRFCKTGYARLYSACRKRIFGVCGCVFFVSETIYDAVDCPKEQHDRKRE